MEYALNELKEKATPELEKLLKATREEVRDFRFRVAAKQHKDVRDLRAAKHAVAKILTILNARRRGLPTAGQSPKKSGRNR